MKRIPLWIRGVIIGLSVLAAVYAFILAYGWYPASEHQDDFIKQRLDQNTAERKTEWVEESFQVYTGSEQDPVCVKGKTAIYSGVWPKLDKERHDVPVTAFVTENGRVWAGPKEKYYVETKSDVVVIDVHSQFISWTDTMVTSRPSEKMDIDRVVQRLEKAILSRGIVGTFKYHQGKFVTSFEFIKKYNISRRSSEEGFRLASIEKPIQLDGSIAQLNIIGGSHTNGTLWVDINTRKLQKVALDGKLVFTKWWPWL